MRLILNILRVIKFIKNVSSVDMSKENSKTVRQMRTEKEKIPVATKIFSPFVFV